MANFIRAVIICIVSTFFLFTQAIQDECNTKNITSTEGGLPALTKSLSFMLYARGLPVGLDYFDGFPDPYVVFYKNSGVDQAWVKYVETQSVQNSRKPNWEEIFIDNEILLNADQKWRFDLWDYDPVGQDDYIGTVTIAVEELVCTKDTFVTKKIEPSMPSSGHLIFTKIQLQQ